MKNIFFAITFAFSQLAFAAPISIEFDALYTNNVFFTPSDIGSPVGTKLAFSFDSQPGAISTSDGVIIKLFASGINSVFSDSEVFDGLPNPHISWDAGVNGSLQGNVYVTKRTSDGAYRFTAVNGLSYSPCSIGCERYFKSISVVSNFFIAFGYDPFNDPLVLLHDLQSNHVSFESTLSQTSSLRLGNSTRTTGANLGTSLYSIGQESEYLGGGAFLISVKPNVVPEPATLALFAFGLLGFLIKRRKS